MKKFNRVLALVLAFVMLTAVGCGGSKEAANAPAEGEVKDTLTIAQSADPKHPFLLNVRSVHPERSVSSLSFAAGYFRFQ